MCKEADRKSFIRLCEYYWTYIITKITGRCNYNQISLWCQMDFGANKKNRYKNRILCSISFCLEMISVQEGTVRTALSFLAANRKQMK